MDLQWLQMGAREYQIRALFQRNTWGLFLERFPEIKEISFIGQYGTWTPSVPGAKPHDRLEIYLIPESVIRENTSDDEWRDLVVNMYQFLLKKRITSVPLEVKVETNYLDNFSGWVTRQEFPTPVHYWHHRGISGYSKRIIFTLETERLWKQKSS